MRNNICSFVCIKNPLIMVRSTDLALCLFILLIGGMFPSCVPSNKYQELKAKNEDCQEEREELRSRVQNLEAEKQELETQVSELTKRKKALKKDTSMLGSSLRQMRAQYDKINALNDELLKKHAALREGKERENEKLMEKLEETKRSLQQKEDNLEEMEARLEEKEENLNALGKELKKREQRVDELEQVLARKDSAVAVLRKKVKDALLRFEDQGLSVEQKDGKVYVNMEAKLLFPSGSTRINEEGKEALVDLAKAIQDKKDLHVLVEGHTDKDKVSPNASFQDNWDLSVLRATSVVRWMLEKSDLDPERVTAAGRSKYVPEDPDNKAKNRRIEVILSPDLDELFKIIKEPAVGKG